MRRTLLLAFAAAACQPSQPSGEGVGGAGGGGGEGGMPCSATVLPSDRRLESAFGFLSNEVQAGNAAGAGVALIDQGRVVDVATAGRISVDGCLPFDADVPVEIQTAGVFTAAVALKLAQRDDLDLDAPLSRYVPEARFVGDAEGITVGRLLQSAAGLPPEADVTCEDTSAAIAGMEVPLWYPPGMLQQPSLLGLIYAGQAMEVAARRPFPELMEQELLRPLGLTATYDAREAQVRGGLVSQLGDCPPFRAFTLRISLRDLATFTAALVAPSSGVLADRELLFDGRGPSFRPSDASGLGGLETFRFEGDVRAAFWEDAAHTGSGSTPTELLAFPDAGFGVVTVSVGARTREAVSITYGSAFAVAQPLFGDFAPFPGALPQDRWMEYTGTYRDPLGVGKGPRLFQVVLADGQLVVRVDGLDFPLFLPDAVEGREPDVFLIDIGAMQEVLRFWRAADGDVVAMSGVQGLFGPPAFRVDRN